MDKQIDFDTIKTINVDFIVGFGRSCRVAASLKRNNLRYFSSPFDWMLNYPLGAVIPILESVSKGKKPDFFC